MRRIEKTGQSIYVIKRAAATVFDGTHLKSRRCFFLANSFRYDQYILERDVGEIWTCDAFRPFPKLKSSRLELKIENGRRDRSKLLVNLDTNKPNISQQAINAPAWLAQSVERETLNLKAAGSTPASGSIPDASYLVGYFDR